MYLKSFQIKNFKSIIDSGQCFLSLDDGITILAGQNEAGKSSILQALYSFESDTISEDILVETGEFPEISFTYGLEDKELMNSIDFEKFDFRFNKLFSSLKEITLIRRFVSISESSLEFDNTLIKRIEGVIDEMYETNSSFEIKSDTISGETVKLDCNEVSSEFANDVLQLTPNIIFFDDFCDILPRKINISDLISKSKTAKGYQAVKNIETILGANFNEFDDLSDAKREVKEDVIEKAITANFNEYWTQKIEDEVGAKIHVKYNQGKAENASYFSFFIETKEGCWLTPDQRSQGFKWFLSFYLHLKAESKRNSNLIILFDEPGLFLHSKAQKDMIKVLEELSIKNQIIYATHSPYLINTEKLHRIRLVLNLKETGTIIEKITTNKISKNESLKPIIDAMGLDIALPFSPINKNNVIVEGISDFYYFNAFKKILKIETNVNFIPSMGVQNVHLLMELCIGWNLNWLIIFDEKDSLKEYNKIKKHFFENNDDLASSHIYRLKNASGIEDLLDVTDLQLVRNDISKVNGQKNSEILSTFGGKELLARLFYEKTLSKEINDIKISKLALDNFKDVFSFIKNNIEK